MKNLSMLAIISLIVLSSCGGKTVKTQGHVIDMQNGLVDYREFTFDDKKKTMTSRVLSTEPFSEKQHGSICVTPEVFNKGFAEWQKIKCK